MIKPDHKPEMMHKATFQYETVSKPPATKLTSLGKKAYDNKNTVGVMRTVDTTNWRLSDASTSGFSCTRKQWVEKNVVIKLMTMPTDEMTNGKPKAEDNSNKSGDCDVKTNAAHVDSANEPNKSAPMPAMSPTLSPTLLRNRNHTTRE